MSDQNLGRCRKRLQAALALIASDPDEAERQIWKLFKDVKTPEVQTIIVESHDTEDALRRELAQVRDQLRNTEFRLEQARLEPKRRTGHSYIETDASDKEVRDMLKDDSVWTFMIFTPESTIALIRMLNFVLKVDVQMRVVHFPLGVLRNGEPCSSVLVHKYDLDFAVLAPALRQYFGYECLSPDKSLFTLGIKPEDDAKLTGRELFGQNR